MQLFANNVTVYINQSVSSIDTKILLDDVSKLPSISGSDYFTITFFVNNAGVESNWEVVKVTAVSGNECTVVRGFDGTNAREWLVGSVGQMRITKTAMETVTTNSNTALGNAAAAIETADEALSESVIRVKTGDLAESSGASLVGFVSEGDGAAPTDVESVLRETVSVKMFGAKLDGLTNDLPAFQAAVNASRNVFVPPGVANFNGTLQINTAVVLHCATGTVEIQQSMQNAAHIQVGDGTNITRSSSIGTTISGFTFAPSAGVAQFVSGACIKANYAAFLTIDKCDFYGSSGINKLWNGIEFDRVEDSWITDCRARFLRGNALKTVGASGVENRTVDVVVRRFRTASCDQDHIYFGPHTQGMFLTDWICIGVAVGMSGLHINADPSTEQGTNYFIVNPNIEGGNNINSNAIYVQKGQAADVIGGWIGGFNGTGSRSVWFDTGSSSSKLTGMRIDAPNLHIDGPAITISNCDISGDSVVSNGVRISAGSTTITGGRIRQFSGSGVYIYGTPTNVNIGPMIMSNIGGENYITGAAYADGPCVTGISTITSKTVSAASTIVLNYGRKLFQVTGSTIVSNISLRAPGDEVTIQAGAGGVTFNNAGNLVLRGASASVIITAYSATKFVCDGSNWFQI